MKIHVPQRYIAGNRHGQLAAGHHVQTKPLLGHDARQRRVDVRLGRIDGFGIWIAGRKSVGKLPATGPERYLVEHVQRRAVLLHQIQRIAATQGQVPGSVRIGGVRKNMGKVGGQHG